MHCHNISLLLTDALVSTSYRSLELFGTFLPFNDKTSVGEKRVMDKMVVILRLYIVEVLYMEIILSYKMLAQQMVMPI